MRWTDRFETVKENMEEKSTAVARAARQAFHGDFHRARDSLREGGIEWQGSLGETRVLGIGKVGLLSVGAFAIGAFAIGAFAIGRLSVGRAQVGEAEIGHLKIGRLEVEQFVPPSLRALSGRNRHRT